MNAGFFPEEGKYNRTACVRCFAQYSYDEAVRQGWRCPGDGGIIKKGVSDRARELSYGGIPSKRPPYLHIIPLGQIIQTIEGASSPHTKKCQVIYDLFISTFGNEIEVLVNTPLSDIHSVNSRVAEAIEILRAGRVTLHAGRGPTLEVVLARLLQVKKKHGKKAVIDALNAECVRYGVERRGGSHKGPDVVQDSFMESEEQKAHTLTDSGLSRVSPLRTRRRG